MSIRLFVAVFLTLLVRCATAQQPTYVQMSGMVLSSDTSRSPIPYATVYNRSLNIGTYTNMDGFYALVVRPGDSVTVTSIGYKDETVVVPQATDAWLFTFLLEPRAYLLQETTVYPWGTRDQFRQAFLYMNVPDDDLERARKNLSPSEMNFLSATIQNDGPATTASVLRNYQDSYYYKGQIPSYNIFSPIAWANFFSDLKKGKYKDPNKQ
jgi:hypothetical protein